MAQGILKPAVQGLRRPGKWRGLRLPVPRGLRAASWDMCGLNVRIDSEFACNEIIIIILARSICFNVLESWRLRAEAFSAPELPPDQNPPGQKWLGSA